MGASCGMLSHRDSTTRSRSVTGKAVSSARAWSMSIMRAFYHDGLTVAISGSRPKDYQHRRTLSRVRCIAWFSVQRAGGSLPAVWALRVNPERRHLTQVPAVPAGLPLPLNRMPEGVDEYSDTKNARDYVEKKKCRMVRDLNAARPLNRVGKQYEGNSEATKREQSESLHIATRQVGERFRSAARDRRASRLWKKSASHPRRGR